MRAANQLRPFAVATSVSAVVLLAVLAGCEQNGETTGSAEATDPAAVETARRPGSDAPPPAAPEDGSQRAVDAERLAYAEVEDRLVYGFFAFPSDMIEPLPAIIMIHDWWGLNDSVRLTARRLASRGYIVLAVDLYNGETAESPEAARQRMIRVVENPALVESNLRQALDFVGVAGAPSVGTLGWGLGGRVSLDAAIAFPDEIEAVVVIYGQVSTSDDRLGRLQAPVLGLFGARDRAIKAETVSQFTEALERLNKPHDVHVYPNQGRGFLEPDRGNYDPAIAADVWSRVTDFLAVALPPEEDT